MIEISAWLTAENVDRIKQMFRHSRRVGISFGLTSGVITTLGLMSGLNASTGSRTIVIGGILTIAVADAFSDALGIHMSEEAESVHTPRQIWSASLATFFTKLLTALSFLVPVLLLPLKTAIFASIGWGLLILIIFSYLLAKEQKRAPLGVILEHLAVALTVLVLTNWFGNLIAKHFGR